jgi:hypothetical protein
MERKTRGLRGSPRCDSDVSQGAQRAQRLPPEPERAEGGEVREGGNFGGVVLERERLVVGGGDTAAVVRHLNQLGAVLFEPDVDVAGARIQTAA